MNFKILVALVLLVGSLAKAEVWRDTNEWNEEWERRYAEFVEKEMTVDMFTNINSPFFGLSTDCADLTYFARAIFAWQNSLPLILNSRWEGTSERISNRTTRFDAVADSVPSVKFAVDGGQTRTIELPVPLQNGKFRAFLRKLGDDLGTWTLPYDTYPIKIDRDNLRGGIVYLRQGYNRMSPWEAVQTFLRGIPPNPEAPPGHALLVQSVRNSGAIEFIQSTLPKKVRDLSKIYEIELLPTNSQLGFRRFIQPQHVGKRFGEAFEGFSTEQFTEIGREIDTNNCGGESYGSENCFSNTGETRSRRRNIQQFRKDVMERLALQAETGSERNERIVKTLCGAIRQRADVILSAESKRLSYRGACMNLGDYDSFSTPSRDEQIRQFIKQLSFWGNETSKLIRSCGNIKIDLSETLYSIESLVNNFRAGKYSSNPNEKILAKWGFESESNRCSDPNKKFFP